MQIHFENFYPALANFVVYSALRSAVTVVLNMKNDAQSVHLLSS